MKANEKKVILVLIVITVIVGIIAVTKFRGTEEKVTEGNEVIEEFVEVLEDGTSLNISDKLHETKKFEGMEITDFQLTEKDNVSLLLGTITNKSEKEQGGYPVDITVLDKKGNEIITISAYIGKLQPGQSTQLSTNATFDFANAYDFKISKKK